MKIYEAIYIAHPSIEQEALDKLIGHTKSMLKKRKGDLLYDEVLGKKRLAYPVRKQRFGTYVLLQFRAEGDGNAQLNQDLELEENILAHMIVRIEEDEVREARPPDPEDSSDGAKEAPAKSEDSSAAESEEPKTDTAKSEEAATEPAESEAAAKEASAETEAETKEVPAESEAEAKDAPADGENQTEEEGPAQEEKK